MNTTDYRKLASRCEKHIKGLSIAIDGVVKAEAAGQDYMVRSSISRAKACLTEVLNCMENSSDQNLLAPLHRMDKALAEMEDGKLADEIERDLHEFRALLDDKAHDVDASSKEMTYSGTTLG